MNRKNKLCGIIIVASLVLAASLYYAGGELFGDSLRFRANFWFHKAEYYEVAQRFLNQDKIKNIAFTATSQAINRCSSNQFGNWACATGDYSVHSDIALIDTDAVLGYLGIPKSEYQYFAGFAKKYGLEGLGKDNEERFVEIEAKLDGLRYYGEDDAVDFVKDSEYLSVKKIDQHWFSYYRDWN
jgi:hypothetical protein